MTDEDRKILERWRAIVDFPGYEVSDLGRVRSWKKMGTGSGLMRAPRMRKLVPDKEGYLTVILRRDGKSFCAKVASLVAVAFVGPRPMGKNEVRHLNGKNQDNVWSNLQWGSRRDQFEDQLRHGTDTRGVRNGAAKLSAEQVKTIRQMLLDGHTGVAVARRFNVGGATITRIKKGVRYATVI